MYNISKLLGMFLRCYISNYFDILDSWFHTPCRTVIHALLRQRKLRLKLSREFLTFLFYYMSINNITDVKYPSCSLVNTHMYIYVCYNGLNKALHSQEHKVTLKSEKYITAQDTNVRS
jgi:hypothetical protein